MILIKDAQMVSATVNDRTRIMRPKTSRLIRKVRRCNLTYLSKPALKDLARAAIQTERECRMGAIIEAGTALGGSAIVLASTKKPGRDMWIYDAFDLIPPPSDKDGTDVLQRYAEIKSGRSKGLGGEKYYGYRNDLVGEVENNLEAFGVPSHKNGIGLVKGNYKKTMHIDFPVALAHIDCDWYESVKTCLDRISPNLVIGGRMIIDDFYEWSGCRQAVTEFMGNNDNYTVEVRGRLHLIRHSSDTPQPSGRSQFGQF